MTDSIIISSFTITWAFPTEFARRSANAELEVVTPLHEITVVRRQGDPYGPKKHPPNKDRPKDPPNNNSTPGNQKTKPPATTRDIGVGFDAEVMSPSEIIHVRLQERDPGVPDCGSKGDCPKEHPGKGHPDQGHPDPPNNNSTPGKQKTKPHAMARDVDITISEPINSHLQQRDPGDTPLIRPDRSQGHLPTTHNSKSDPRSGNGPDSIKKKNPPTAREVDTEFNVDSSTPSLPSNPSRRLPRDADVGPVIDEAATSLNVRNIGIDLTMADAGTPASKAYLGSRDVGPKGPKNPASAPKKPPPSVEGGGTVAVIGPSPDHRHEPSQPKKPPKARGISINSDKADVKASLAGPVACKEGEKDCSKSNPTPKEAPTQKKPAPKVRSVDFNLVTADVIKFHANDHFV